MLDIYRYTCGSAISLQTWCGAGAFNGGAADCYSLESGNPIAYDGIANYHFMYQTQAMNRACGITGYRQLRIQITGKYRTGFGVPPWTAVLLHGGNVLGTYDSSNNSLNTSISLVYSSGGKYYLNYPLGLELIITIPVANAQVQGSLSPFDYSTAVPPLFVAAALPPPPPSPTPTNTPSNTRTPPNTPTNSRTPTITPTISRSKSPTPSISLSPSITPSVTKSLTPTRTPTRTPPVTSTVTRTITPTITQTLSPTRTPTITRSVTPTETPTATTTRTPTSTPPVTKTATSTGTQTPTITKTLSPTKTSTATVTRTPVATQTATPTRTTTQTVTPTPTITRTTTTSFSPTPTTTKTPATTNTPTTTSTITSTVTRTITNTNTPTKSPPPTPEPTSSNTATPTTTTTPTVTPTITSTQTPTPTTTVTPSPQPCRFPPIISDKRFYLNSNGTYSYNPVTDEAINGTTGTSAAYISYLLDGTKDRDTNEPPSALSITAASGSTQECPECVSLSYNMSATVNSTKGGSTWITLKPDKLPGDASKTVTFQYTLANACGFSETKTFTATVDSTSIRRQIFFDADYVTATYVFAGNDLETRAGIIVPGGAQSLYLGATTDTSIIFPNSTLDLMSWSGDLSLKVAENYLINLKNLKASYPTTSTFTFDFRAFWKTVKPASNYVGISFKFFKGGTATATGTTIPTSFTITGSTDTKSINSAQLSMATVGSVSNTGVRVATLSYDFDTGSIIINSNDKTTPTL